MRALAAAALLALAGPAAARAADVGGGTAPSSVRDYRRQLTLLTIRQATDGSAIVRATIAARCGVAHVKRSGVRIGPDGSFAFTATVRDHPPEDPRVRRVAAVAIHGRFAAPVVAGTANARIKRVRHGRVVERCTSGARTWQARAPAPQTVAGSPRANGAYYGLAAQSGRPRSVLLGVGPSAKRVRAAAFEYRLACRHRTFERDNVMGGGPIAADGTFSLRERFTVRYANGNERVRVKVDGRFTPAGANGTLSVRSTFGGDHCATGVVRWAAAL
jgi:hypothetical protein